MDGRTLLLGDWGPVVRDPIDLLRAQLLVGAVVVAATGSGGWVNLTASALVALGARFVDLPRLYDLSVVLAMTITGWGDALGFYDAWSNFDRVVHVLVPMLIAPVVYIVLARLEVVPDPVDHSERHHLVGVFVVTLALGLAIGALWEIFEWTSDHVFGSNLSHGETDTIGDLVADGSGALVGGALLVVWTVYGWGSVRRIPGENRAEQQRA